MNNLDEKLTNARPLPRRELSSDFTARITTELTAHPLGRKKESLIMQLFHKPILIAALSLTLVGAISGTAYAGTDGFTRPFSFSNIFGYSEQTDKNGNLLFTVQTGECNPATLTDKQTEQKDDRTMYFRLKKDSSLARDDVLRYVQGYCENQALDWGEVRDTIDKRFGASIDKLFYAYGPVTSHDSKSLSVKYEDVDGVKNTKINSYAPNALMLSAGKAMQPADIVDGRNVTVSARETPNGLEALFVSMETESIAYGNAHHEQFTKEVERVVPCDSDASGYCTRQEQATKPADKTKPDAVEALNFIKKAYDEYAPNVTEAGKAQFAKYTTPEVVASFSRPTGADPIICAQNDTGSLIYGVPSINGDKATVTISAKFTELTNLADVTYSFSQKKIVAIDCIASDINI